MVGQICRLPPRTCGRRTLPSPHRLSFGLYICRRTRCLGTWRASSRWGAWLYGCWWSSILFLLGSVIRGNGSNCFESCCKMMLSVEGWEVWSGAEEADPESSTSPGRDCWSLPKTDVLGPAFPLGGYRSNNLLRAWSSVPSACAVETTGIARFTSLSLISHVLLQRVFCVNRGVIIGPLVSVSGSPWKQNRKLDEAPWVCQIVNGIRKASMCQLKESDKKLAMEVSKPGPKGFCLQSQSSKLSGTHPVTVCL